MMTIIEMIIIPMIRIEKIIVMMIRIENKPHPD